jgi:outer membrane biosynthesis protein TonB
VDDGKGLDPGQIRVPIKRNSAQVKACYERELKKNPGLAGKIAMAFTIGADGTVRAAKATRNSTGSMQLARCVASRVRGWVFPQAEGATEVEYPFVFEPRNF